MSEFFVRLGMASLVLHFIGLFGLMIGLAVSVWPDLMSVVRWLDRMKAKREPAPLWSSLIIWSIKITFMAGLLALAFGLLAYIAGR